MPILLHLLKSRYNQRFLDWKLTNNKLYRYCSEAIMQELQHGPICFDICLRKCYISTIMYFQVHDGSFLTVIFQQNVSKIRQIKKAFAVISRWNVSGEIVSSHFPGRSRMWLLRVLGGTFETLFGNVRFFSENLKNFAKKFSLWLKMSNSECYFLK